MPITPAQRRELAALAGMSDRYLDHCLTGRAQMRPANAVRVVGLSKGLLREWHLRTHDWHEVWPHLIGRKGAPEVPTTEAA